MAGTLDSSVLLQQPGVYLGPGVYYHIMAVAVLGKKYMGGGWPLIIGRQQWLSEITIDYRTN